MANEHSAPTPEPEVLDARQKLVKQYVPRGARPKFFHPGTTDFGNYKVCKDRTGSVVKHGSSILAFTREVADE